MNGAKFLAKYLQKLGIKRAYGLVGIPITALAIELVSHGIPFIGFRNEQAASYAGSIDAFLNEESLPGVLLTVSGPGFIHALPGIINAKENRWPLFVIVATLNDSDSHAFQGQFQEYNHSSLVLGWSKFENFTSRSTDLFKKLDELIIYTQQGNVNYGGISILQVSGIWLECQIEEVAAESSAIRNQQYNLIADLEGVRNVIIDSQKPLIVFGKEAAFLKLETLCEQLVEQTQIPFITMPMARGILPDDHYLHMVAARSLCLKESDVIILIGVQINWMLPLHKRMAEDPSLRVIRLDCEKQDFDFLSKDHNHRVHNVAGDIRTSLESLILVLRNKNSSIDEWLSLLREESGRNRTKLQHLLRDNRVPLGYHPVYDVVKDFIIPKTILITEGSNTMDIARMALPSFLPRRRLDAGYFAAMGVGMPYAIAASINFPTDQVLYVAGDSAFGFSMAEIETAIRYGLKNITIIIMNNSGIYSGIEFTEYESIIKRSSGTPLLPPTALTPNTRYDKLSALFSSGIQGFQVETLEELRYALLSKDKEKISVINVVVDAPKGKVPGTRHQ